MANIFLGWPNRGDAATITGGSWEADLPVSNVQQRAASLAARSTDDAKASTQFDLDFGAAIATRAVALVATNLSQAALIKVSWGTSSGGSQVATTGWVSAFPITIAYGGIEWPSTGSLGAEFIVFAATNPAASARYVRVEIDDTLNADGFVSIGRLWIGDGFMPTYNAVYGLERWRDSVSETAQTMSGVTVSNRRRNLRATRFALELLSVAEANVIDELTRRQDVTDEVLFLPDMSRREVSQQYGFLARCKAVPRLILPSYMRRSTIVELAELV